MSGRVGSALLMAAALPSGLAMLAMLAMLSSCGGDVPARQDWQNTWAGDGEDLFLVDDDLVCLGDARWELIGKSRLWNPLGHQLQAAEHARSNALGPYPVGTVLALFADEVSVKRGLGFSPETGDWEFLILTADDEGKTVIRERGTTAPQNIGGSCIDCHAGAAAFDFACFSNSGCGALPFFVDTDVDPQTEDPRCR